VQHVESSWIRVVCTGASATHDDSHPSVLAFLAFRIDSARENLELLQEKFSAQIRRTHVRIQRRWLQGVGVRWDSPVRLSVVLAQGHPTAVAPRARQLVRLAAEVGDHNAAATAGGAWLRSDRLGGFRGHGARA
jgi:hypothetical protein